MFVSSSDEQPGTCRGGVAELTAFVPRHTRPERGPPRLAERLGVARRMRDAPPTGVDWAETSVRGVTPVEPQTAVA